MTGMLQEYRKTLTGDNNKNLINLRLSLLKPIGFQRLESACSYIQTSDFVQKGFHAASITEILADIM